MKEVLEGFRKVCWCSRYGEGETRVVWELGQVGSTVGRSGRPSSPDGG